MEAPAAPATVLACCFASSPTVTGIFSPFTAVTEEKSMSMRASRPKMRGCTTFLIVALPRAPFGRTRASPTYTLSSAIKSTLSPAWAVLLLMSSMNLILIRESFGSVTVWRERLPEGKALFVRRDRRDRIVSCVYWVPNRSVSRFPIRVFTPSSLIRSANCHSMAFIWAAMESCVPLGVPSRRL